MKFGERVVYREPGNPELGRQRSRRRQSRRAIAEIARPQLIADLAVKLVMERLGRAAIQPHHFEVDDRSLAPSIRSRLRHDETDAAPGIGVHLKTSRRDCGIQLACAVPAKWLWQAEGEKTKLMHENYAGAFKQNATSASSTTKEML